MMPTPYRSSNDLFSPLFEEFVAPLARMNRMDGMLRVPDADVVERENEIRVVVELPGLGPEDVDLSLENNVLSITGEKREERREGDEKSRYHLSERRYGKFTRSFVLPREVDAESIRASFDNGVLTITIPKSEKARRRRIEIAGGQGRPREVEATTSGEKR